MNLDPLDIWRRAMVDGVRRDAPDLSARQMAVLLTVYLTPPPHTVRGLAAILNVSKPAITRALDRLGEFNLARRKTDSRDRRSVLVQRTVKGSVYLAEFADIITRASEASEQERAARAPAASAKAPAKSPAKPAGVKTVTAKAAMAKPAAAKTVAKTVAKPAAASPRKVPAES